MANTNILKEYEKRSKTLAKLIEELAQDNEQNVLKTKASKNDYYMKLDGIYRNLRDGTEFRHSYSDIFIILSSIDNK